MNYRSRSPDSKDNGGLSENKVKLDMIKYSRYKINNFLISISSVIALVEQVGDD
jgi:hypothetical protein